MITKDPPIRNTPDPPLDTTKSPEAGMTQPEQNMAALELVRFPNPLALGGGT